MQSPFTYFSQASAFKHRLSCENIYALCLVTAPTACLFSIKQGAKMSVLYLKIVKIHWRLPDPLLASGGCFAKSSVRH